MNNMQIDSYAILLRILAWLVIWSLFFSVIRPSSDSDSLNSFHPFIELNSVQTARLLCVLRLLGQYPILSMVYRKWRNILNE